MSELSYPYRPRPFRMALASLFFGVCAIFAGYSALHNDSGLIIDGLIRLDPGQATVFFWGLLVCSIGFVVMGVLGVVRGLTSHRQLVLAELVVQLPKSGFSNGTTFIPYAAVVAMRRFEIKGQHFLTLDLGRRAFNISSGMLPSREIFEHVCSEITRRVELSRGYALREGDALF